MFGRRKEVLTTPPPNITMTLDEMFAFLERHGNPSVYKEEVK